MKKNKFLILFIFVLTFCSLSSGKKAEARELQEIFNYEAYLGKDYTQYANQTFVKDYMDGIIGHKQYLQVGNVKLIAKEVERITDPVLVGDDSSLVLEQTTSYTLLNQTTLSMSSEITIQTMIEAAANLKGVADVRVKEELTQKYMFGVENMFSEVLEKAFKITTQKDLSVIPKDKIKYNIGRVSVFLQFEIVESYISELWWWNWHKQNETSVKNYYANFYIDDIVTFVYNDNTFGNTISGTFPLQRAPIKIY